MRALILAFLLSVAAVVPAFASDGGEYRPTDVSSVITTVDNWDGAR